MAEPSMIFENKGNEIRHDACDGSHLNLTQLEWVRDNQLRRFKYFVDFSKVANDTILQLFPSKYGFVNPIPLWSI